MDSPDELLGDMEGTPITPGCARLVRRVLREWAAQVIATGGGGGSVRVTATESLSLKDIALVAHALEIETIAVIERGLLLERGLDGVRTQICIGLAGRVEIEEPAP